MDSQHPLPGQQPIDSTPQDVLAEARKNLQVLIDSGISKDLLHQWVDGSPSLQLSFLHSQATSSGPPSIPTSHSPAQQQPFASPPGRSQSQSDASVSSASTASPGSSGVSSATTPTELKHELTSEHNKPGMTAWSAPTVPSHGPVHENLPVAEQDNVGGNGFYFNPSIPLSHRARISVSSTSSGSSGHASLWSVGSARSSMSWQSASSARTQAPLPMLPTGAAPIINGSQVGAATSTNKQNVYWCTSCDTSFKRKYDWKRHEDEFHERWRKYPCPEPGCNRSFWGSNSFNQHHKQCHNCTTCPHAEKVVKFLRKRKFWACGFCSALHPARERHVEHVARHFESGLTKNDWMHSRVIYGLLHQPLIHTAWEALVAEKQSSYGGRRPNFSWHPSKTGRAQGFLEKENPGQLQDLLEFFSGDEAEAKWVVSVAHELADIVKSTSTSSASTASAPTAGGQAMQTNQSYPQDSQQPQQQQQSYTPHSQQPTVPSSQRSSFASSQFGAGMYSTNQSFNSGPRLSTDSSSTSPLALSSHAVPSSSGEKREAIHSQGDGMMDFEYSPPPVMYGDWGSLNQHLIGGTSQAQTHQHQQQQQTSGDWSMMQQYFSSDPRVTS